MTNDKNTFCQLSHPAPVSPFENFRMPIMNPSANNTKPSLCLIRRVPEIVSRIDILITILDLNPEDKLGEFLLDLHYSIQRLYVRKQDDITQICQELIQIIDKKRDVLNKSEPRYIEGLSMNDCLDKWRLFLFELSKFSPEDNYVAWTRHPLLHDALDAATPGNMRVNINLNINKLLP